VFSPPPDLPEASLRAALDRGWSLNVVKLEYRPVGFGSHHWEARGEDGVRRFVTVDDLRTGDFGRLRAALDTAGALRAAGRDFVVAPIPSRDGEPLTRLGHFAVAVYPFVAGERADVTLDLLLAVHTAPPEVRDRALRDDYALPFRDALFGGRDRETGPYAGLVIDLLAVYADTLRRALARYDDLVAAADSPDLVLTHGEPHPGNVMRTRDGLVLIDWDTALVAPPERDLWDLDPGDGSLHAAYTAATGTTLRPALFHLYRLRWDLTEIAIGAARFREPHGATADDEETWNNLRGSLAAIV
jgi:spectinomycin phosphotransferase/16S rRNA (guanine(1405)-N(7))-methyltransferase